jgi:membrane protease YdiL (CAAX protease family)
MSTPTPYLDGMILMAASNPAGFSYSLFTAGRRGTAPGGSTAFLAVLVLPFAVVLAAVGMLRPELLAFREASPLFLFAAVLLAPLALLLEYLPGALRSFRNGGRLLAPVSVDPFWGRKFTAADHALLVLVAVGEELFYRGLWLGALQHTFGLPLPVALLLSSVAYGVNHLGFGARVVLLKTMSGLLYGGIYLAGGESLLLPIVTHTLQNALIFVLARRSDA